jgi:hypothetical protein
VVHDITSRPDDAHGLERCGPRNADHAEHQLKCWPEFFEAIVAGEKTHDLRRADDRDFHVGDTLLLQEFDPEARRYTGRTTRMRITFITSAKKPCALSREALHPDFCILSIAPTPKPQF